MEKLPNLTKIVLVAVAIMGLAACNGSDNTVGNTSSPQNIFTSVTLQNHVDSTTGTNYQVKITSTGIKTDESSIYFALPKDAVDKGMLKLNALSLRVNTNANESIFIGDMAITPNSNANPLIDFNESANLKLKIIPFGESSAKVFNLHLESSESANIVIQSLELQRSKTESLSTILTEVDELEGLIISHISYDEDFNSELNLVLYPKFTFAGSILQPTAKQENQAVPFIHFKGIDAFFGYYTILSHDKNTTAIYTNILTKTESSVASIINFKLESDAIRSLEINQTTAGGNISINTPTNVTKVSGKAYMSSLGKSIAYGEAESTATEFHQGDVLTFDTTTTNNIYVRTHDNIESHAFVYTVTVTPDTPK